MGRKRFEFGVGSSESGVLSSESEFLNYSKQNFRFYKRPSSKIGQSKFPLGDRGKIRGTGFKTDFSTSYFRLVYRVAPGIWRFSFDCI